jgi:ribosomal protein S18 acetylase RimI-like enzyme
VAERDWGWTTGRTDHLDFVVRDLEDPDEIRGLLAPRVEYAAYAVGQLEPAYFKQSHWYRAVGDSGTAIVVHSKGGLGEATFVMGDTHAAHAILTLHPGPAQTYVTCQLQHLAVMRDIYRVSSHQPMLRMSVTRDRFQPVRSVETIQLTGVDIRRVNGLYSSEGAASYYAPEHIDSGLYRGIVRNGMLVAVAGTHVVARHEGVAVVGNVFTHPRYRGYGYATATTSAVTEALLEFCDVVVLTVDPTNAPAVRAYRKLGYIEVCQLVEATASRRDPLGWGAGLRRWRAGMRGRRYGGRFVSVRPSPGPAIRP